MTWPYDGWKERLQIARVFEALCDQTTVDRIVNSVKADMDRFDEGDHGHSQTTAVAQEKIRLDSRPLAEAVLPASQRVDRGPVTDDPTRAELLEELRRAHSEIDRWRRCASRWQALFLAAETRLGRALEGVDEPSVVISDWARTDGRHIDNVPIVGERL